MIQPSQCSRSPGLSGPAPSRLMTSGLAVRSTDRSERLFSAGCRCSTRRPSGTMLCSQMSTISTSTLGSGECHTLLSADPPFATLRRSAHLTDGIQFAAWPVGSRATPSNHSPRTCATLPCRRAAPWCGSNPARRRRRGCSAAKAAAGGRACACCRRMAAGGSLAVRWMGSWRWGSGAHNRLLTLELALHVDCVPMHTDGSHCVAGCGRRRLWWM